MLGVLENRFTYHDKAGHEIIFVYAASFSDQAFYARDVIDAVEHSDNSTFKLYWMAPTQLPEGMALYPDGLKELLQIK